MPWVTLQSLFSYWSIIMVHHLTYISLLLWQMCECLWNASLAFFSSLVVCFLEKPFDSRCCKPTSNELGQSGVIKIITARCASPASDWLPVSPAPPIAWRKQQMLSQGPGRIRCCPNLKFDPEWKDSDKWYGPIGTWWWLVRMAQMDFITLKKMVEQKEGLKLCRSNYVAYHHIIFGENVSDYISGALLIGHNHLWKGIYTL